MWSSSIRQVVDRGTFGGKLLRWLKGNFFLLEIFQDCTMCVAVFSNIRQLPACQVFRITHTDYTVHGVHLISVGYLLEPMGKRVPRNIRNFFLTFLTIFKRRVSFSRTCT